MWIHVGNRFFFLICSKTWCKSHSGGKQTRIISESISWHHDYICSKGTRDTSGKVVNPWEIYQSCVCTLCDIPKSSKRTLRVAAHAFWKLGPISSLTHTVDSVWRSELCRSWQCWCLLSFHLSGYCSYPIGNNCAHRSQNPTWRFGSPAGCGFWAGAASHSPAG